MGLGLDGMQKMNGAINVDFMTEDFAKKATALGFYKQYRVSAELGSQIAGMMEKEFIDYLEENGVSVWK